MTGHLPERTRWAIVMAFAIAMAWVEAASVLYLRALVDRIEPYQADPLPMSGALGNVELWREAATLGHDRRAGTSSITSSFASSRAGRRRCWTGTSCSCCRFHGGGLCSRPSVSRW